MAPTALFCRNLALGQPNDSNDQGGTKPSPAVLPSLVLWVGAQDHPHLERRQVLALARGPRVVSLGTCGAPQRGHLFRYAARTPRTCPLFLCPMVPSLTTVPLALVQIQSEKAQQRNFFRWPCVHLYVS